MKRIGGRRVNIPHSGGVWIGPDSSIGSSTAVDRGLFGTFTTIGADCHVDNLVHVAHNVELGDECAIVAGTVLAGSAIFGRGVWFGPGAVCNPEIVFGDHSYVGSGSVVTRDVPAFTLVAGSPARPFGTVCRCRAKVDLDAGTATCATCGTQLVKDEDGTIRLAG